MANTLETELEYTGDQPAGVVVLIVCSGLSLISVLGVFIVLGVSLVRSRRSSDKTLFVRTHVATYFVSLLLCNLDQAIGGLLNIPWVVADRVYAGVTCTTQGVTKQIGNVGAAIFCFVIAVHTFNLLFLRRQWSNRTCHIVLVVSWALVLLEVCIEGFVLADPKKGPYFGIAGFWCWITAAYPIPRYATSYLIQFLSAGLSFILYLLVFFRLRGNITVAAGYKIYFHRRPKVRLGRTSDGAYIVTDDQRVGSHLTKVATHMLWYPIVYTIIILPIGASRFSTFSGAPVPSAVTIFAASLYMLHGFINTLLFCTTRNILPGSWRQRLGLTSTWESGRSELDLSSRSNPTWRFTGLGARIGAVGTGTAPAVISVGVEKDVEIAYDGAYSSPGYIKFGSPSSAHTPNPRVQDGGEQRVDTHKHHVQRFSFPAPRDARRSIRVGVDRVDDDHYPGAEVHPVRKAKTVERGVSLHPLGRASSRHESDVYGPAPGLATPASAHQFATTGTTDKKTNLITF